MKPSELRDLNVIGAFALAVADDFKDAMQDLADGNESACSALIVIGQESGLSVDRLSKILRLSQPGTVRLVDRLAEAKLVERKTGSDRRSVALRLTDAGKRQVKSLLVGRQHALSKRCAGSTTGNDRPCPPLPARCCAASSTARSNAIAAAACATMAPARTRAVR